MIKLNNLTYAYNDDLVLENINLEILDGDYIAIIGQNGSGKTTLINCILGINPVSHNQIQIDNQCISCFKKFNEIGFVAQNKSKVSDIPITGYEYLGLITNNKDKILKVAKQLQVFDFLNKDINTLSGGQRQKINICQALLNDIKYLILDEPINGLDKNSRTNLYTLLSKINSQDITIIIITHNLDEMSNVKRIYNIQTKEVTYA